MTNNELKRLSEYWNWKTDEGTTPEGQKVRRVYRMNGNFDIYLDDKYVGTVWYS